MGKINRQNKRLYEAIEYFESIREELIYLEGEINRIKKSAEFQKNCARLRVAKQVGQIDDFPSKKNRYKTPVVRSECLDEMCDDLFEEDDIEFVS